ncbi:unnamed protein product [Auanema sp. JU1783]|nr:unnamed protein product [Auanema sp. JU1783]
MDNLDSLTTKCSGLSLNTDGNVAAASTTSPKFNREMVVSQEEMVRIMRNLHELRTNELKEVLQKEQLNIQGKKKELQERVRRFYKKHFLLYQHQRDLARPGRKTKKHFDYLVTIDFECTCQMANYDYPHEIIQFPAVLIEMESLSIIDTFDSFVKPDINPILDPFCTSLCGITQENVDSAPSFTEVVNLFYKWLGKHNLGKGGHKFAFVVDGYHDFWKFLQFKFFSLGERMPTLFRSYINMRKTFEQKVAILQRGRGKTGIENMLEHYKLDFDGKLHNGLDDARNMARICIEMIKNKVEFRINERLINKKKANQVQRANPVDDNNSQSDFQVWRQRLPLAFQRVTQQEFSTGEYLDNGSSDEE